MAIPVFTNDPAPEVFKANEAARRDHEFNLRKYDAKLELLRTAKEVLIENRRNLPVSERIVTEEEIVSFATELSKFLES